MSDGRIELQKARAIAEKFIGLVADQCLSIEVCGSIRRGKQTVGDVEIVAVPNPDKRLMARLDSLVVQGVIDQARYDGKVRWGDKTRGVMYGGAKVEVYLADAHNIGYIRALRTGPGDANTLLMTRLKQRRWNVRFSDGYAWQVEYPVEFTDAFKRLHRLNVPDEVTFFRLVGLPYKPVLLPGARDVDVYAHYLETAQMPDADFLKSLYVESAKPKQQEMF